MHLLCNPTPTFFTHKKKTELSKSEEQQFWKFEQEMAFVIYSITVLRKVINHDLNYKYLDIMDT